MSVATLHPLRSFRDLASSPRRGLVEIATLAGLYGVYELVRGQGHATLAAARAHTDGIVALEQNLHIYFEREIQQAAHWVPGMPTLLGIAYITLHFLGTAAFLVWLYRRHPERFPLVRNTLVGATGAALVVYLLYPVAPPRLASLGFVDTVTHNAKVNLSSDLLGSLYNPFAAVPSLHFGYALLVGATIAVIARRRIARLLAWSYPAAMLFIIVATGNHFFIDAFAGALAIGVGYLIASWADSPATLAQRSQPERGSGAALSGVRRAVQSPPRPAHPHRVHRGLRPAPILRAGAGAGAGAGQGGRPGVRLARGSTGLYRARRQRRGREFRATTARPRATSGRSGFDGARMAAAAARARRGAVRRGATPMPRSHGHAGRGAGSLPLASPQHGSSPPLLPHRRGRSPTPAQTTQGRVSIAA